MNVKSIGPNIQMQRVLPSSSSANWCDIDNNSKKFCIFTDMEDGTAVICVIEFTNNEFLETPSSSSNEENFIENRLIRNKKHRVPNFATA